jgi:phage/plasmid-like protein (TIGR03299 family)
MPSYFDAGTGFFVRKPSWHQLEKMIMLDYPDSWEHAREMAALTWDPVAEPVYAEERYLEQTPGGRGGVTVAKRYLPIPGWQQIARDDTGDVLSIQSDAYRVITNTDLGGVVDTVMGTDWNEQQQIEGLFSLHGGRLVICLIRNKKVHTPSYDPSPSLEYTAVCSRHDGSGGLKVIRTNVRVVCANTWGMAEHGSQDGKTSFTVRHTENWDERVAEIRTQLNLATVANQEYFELGEALSLKKVTSAHREKYLERFLPIGSDMSDRQKMNRQNEREQVRVILGSPTCEGIDKTAYGLLQASGEWCDHFRSFRKTDTYVTRNLVTWEPMKARAMRLTKDLAGIR